ncbi:MAG: response regulator [Azospirillum sp.]|nr:response regulator [Azospirillum sp.]
MSLSLRPHDDSPETMVGGADKVRILVVDDEFEAVQEVADTLANFGFEAKTASDYRSAIQEFLLDDSIGVVVADIHMPVHDGVSLAKALRSSGERGEACQIVFVTGHPALATAVEAIKTKVSAYLTKPVDPVELNAAVGTAVDQYRRARADRAEKTAILDIVRRVLEAKEAPAPTARPEASAATEGSLESRRTAQVEMLLKIRDMRAAYLPSDVFGDPAWFMILDLYLSGLRGRKVSVSSLCLASGGSQTTSLRRVHDLVRLGIVLREEDPRDRRRAYLVLSDEAIAHLEAMLDRLRETAAPAPDAPVV